MKKRLLLAVLGVTAFLTRAPGASGQERIEEMDLPPSVADEVVAYFNDPGTVRFNGRSNLPAGSVITGDVGVLGGPFTVAGEIRGALVVVNGDLVFGDNGHVSGDVMVIGGEVEGLFDSSVGGTLIVYDEPLRYAEREGEIRVRPRRTGGFHTPGWATLGQSRFMVRTGGSFNRVEGLPVMIGPIWESPGPDRFRADALAIWRSESGLRLDDDELGYFLRAQQGIAGGRATLGATYHSLIEPISRTGLTSLESSLSTFFLHKDYRDYLERLGWSAFVRVGRDDAPLRFTLEYRDEDHAFAPVSSPWTLRRNDDPWRPQSMVAEGDIRTLWGSLVWDDRNDPDRPSDGWFLEASVVRGVDGSLIVPEVFEEPDPAVAVPAEAVESTFRAGYVDLRRYNRVSPDAELVLRAVYGGSLDGDPVPSQFQRALGGEGSLPGYGLFSVDCRARSRPYYIQRVAFDDADGVQPVFRHYGCDRAAFFQAEYRGHFSFDIDLGPDESGDWEDDWPWYPIVDISPSWVVFFDAGRGWSERDPLLDTQTYADVGAGLYLGDVGLYWAYPLNGNDRNVNFFIRLQRRF